MTAEPTKNLPTPERALAIGAHPDDIEFGAGATLAKWAADGCVVSFLVCTDGSKGTWDVNADTDELIATRQTEQRAAAERMGATGEVRFLGYTDGELESDLVARSKVAKVIRELRPTVVLGHDPWKSYRLHPDHRHAGLLAVEGIVAARDPHFFPEHGVAHHRPDVLLLFEAEVVDHIEVVDGFAHARIAALEEHKSQFESTMFVSDDDAGEQIEAFRNAELHDMREHAAGSGAEFVEAFKIMDDL